MGCSLCQMTVDRFKKWGLKFQIKRVDTESPKNYENLAEYSFYLDRKIDPEFPAILINEKLYSRKEAYEILKPKKERRKKND